MRSSLWLFNWSLCLRAVFDTFSGGSSFVFAAFVLSLGIPKEFMGFINSALSMACILQLLGLVLINRAENKKHFVLGVGLTEPLLLIAAVLAVPLLPPGARIYGIAGAAFLAAATLHLTRPMADEWLASTVPEGVRGRFLGRRFQWQGAALIVASLTAGQMVEHVGKSNAPALAGMVALGAVFGVAAVLTLFRAEMPAISAAARVQWSDLRGALTQAEFRRYLAGLLLYNLPFLLAVPYYQVFNLEVLSMRESLIGYMLAGYLLVRMVLFAYWGRQVDRHGPRYVFLLIGPLYVLFFLGLMAATRGRLWPVMVAWGLAGVGDAAFNVALAAALYGAVPHTPARPAYFALSNLVVMAPFVFGGAMAVPILKALAGVRVQLGPLVLGQFQCFYGLLGLVMIPCILAGRYFVGRRETEPVSPAELRPDR